MSKFQPIQNNGVTFELKCSDYLYYANAVNKIGFIQELQVSSSKIFSDVALEITFSVGAGPISLPFSIPLSSVDSSVYALKRPQVQFDPRALFQISDAQAGTIELRLITGEEVVAVAVWTIDVLPKNFWIDGNTRDDYFALAAFVQPNHPSVRELLTETANELAASGLSTALSGYQPPLAHVDELVEALYNTIKKREINYSNPPASWNVVGGQKIRTPQEILKEGVGTCLDTAVLFASCLEQMGLDPVVAVVPGHAFVGYWTAASKMVEGNPTYTFGPLQTIESVVAYLDAGFIKLFETTVICKGSTADFASATSSGKGNLESYGVFGKNMFDSYLVNIKPFRRADIGINPMDAISVAPDGTVTVTEYKPQETDLAILRAAQEAEEGRVGNTVKLDVPPVVKKWLDSLLDLSLRNPLINMRERQTSVKILAPADSLGLLEDALQKDKVFRLTPGLMKSNEKGEAESVDATNDRGEAISLADEILKQSFVQQELITNTRADGFITRMRRIASETKSFYEETGSNGLYLALGTLHWKTNNAELDSPLILVPVSITAKNRSKDFYISLEESGVTPNFSLVEKLKVEYKLNIDALSNLQTDSFGIDVDKTLEDVRAELLKAGLTDFRVDQTATLGFFNFSSYRLWRDMLDNWQKFERNPLVKHLIHTPNEAFVDPATDVPDANLDELIAQLPIAADGSQAMAISQAIAGKTFVLQGPPGTGKSQTITNLLAKALDEGKRVLFVAEKKDALDVVKQRMVASGIGAFSLDLHDKASTSKAVRQQLDEVIDILITPDKNGFESALQDYEAALGPLRTYKDKLHDLNPLGESIYSAKDKYLALSGSAELEVPGEFIANCTQEQFASLLSASKSIAAMGQSVGLASENPWGLSSRVEAFSAEELEQLKKLSVEIADSLAEVTQDSNVNAFLSEAKTLTDLTLLEAIRFTGLSHSASEFAATKPGREQLAVTRDALLKHLASVQAYPFALDRLSKVDFDALERGAQEAVAANFLFKGGKIKKVIKSLDLQLGVSSGMNKENFGVAIEALYKVQNQGAKCQREIQAVTGLRFEDEPNLNQVASLQQVLAEVEKLATLSDFVASEVGTSELKKSLAADSNDLTRSRIATLIPALKELITLLGASEGHETAWVGKGSLRDRLVAASAEWKRDVREYGLTRMLAWNGLMVAAKPFVEFELGKGLHELISGKVAYSDAANAFQRGFYKTTFENLLVARGLNTFDGNSINNFIRKLDEAHGELRSRLPKILGAELLSRRGFDSSMKIGAIGDLILAIRQSRNSMPLRVLLSRHWDIITRITPCVLASPDSAVRFIDPNFEPFDLVVFDEASQIRVANSIGALGRAKAAVVVGDSQQMPPTSVAQSKTSAGTDEEDENEELYLSEPESILSQCENSRVPDVMLTWHYRSEDESLIAFSNREYYFGKLSTFPTPNLGTSGRKLSLEVVKNGHFIRSASEDKGQFKGLKKAGLRTNPAEATEILKDISARLADPAKAEDSIGIVTFNLQQRQLIESMLQDSNDPNIIKALENGVGGESIFVKNLESVQGSERDVILFSVAFSAKQGEADSLPMNFGPITHANGEKRLNVAITRARREVKIFTSFRPEVLAAKKPPSKGLSNLADYLVMAAATNNDQLQRLALREEKQDRHRHDVLEKLKAAGLTAVEEVGLSDFKVDIAIVDPKKPDHAVLGILLDGPRWQSRTTVSDRDCLPVALLTNRMGWSGIERIWLPTWIRDEKGEIERIKAAYEAAKSAKPKATPKKQTVSAEPIYTKRDVEDVASAASPVDDLLAKTQSWQQADSIYIADQSVLDNLGNQRVRAAVNEAVRVLLETEGPASPNRVGKFVASCFGFNRVVPARIAAINQVVSRDFKRDGEGFIYPLGSEPADFHIWRKSDAGSGRAAAEISLCEIANAMNDICTIAGGVRFEQLVKETSRVFGIQKMSKDILTRFENAVKFGLACEQLKVEGDYISAV